MYTSAEKKLILRHTKIFATVPDNILAEVTEALETVAVKAGEVVFKKGEPGSSMYVIAAGKVRAHDGELLLNTLTAGDVFGEMAALDPDVRSASITAEVDSVLFRLERDALFDLMANQIEVAQAIIHVLSQRLRQQVHHLGEDFEHRQALERELEIGRQIQASFLPEVLPQPPGWEIAAYIEAAREVAGDFYDVFSLTEDTKIALLVGDVADKGVGAALFMSLFRSLLRALANLNYLELSPAGLNEAQSQQTGADGATRLKNAVIQTNNYVAYTHSRVTRFTSLFFGLLDPATGTLVYINGGHEPPVIFGPGGVKARLKPTGPVVGVFPDMDYQIRETRLEPGDILFIYTDGVTDTQNPLGEFFGEERLLGLLAQPALSAATLLDRIRVELRSHMAEKSQFDDITMLAVRQVDAAKT